MENLLHISVSPHIHGNKSTRGFMLDVILALLPAAIAGTVIFGAKALLVIAICIGTCIVSEFLFNLILKREQTIGDLSAVVTGMILALNLPVNLPVWEAILGGLSAPYSVSGG